MANPFPAPPVATLPPATAPVPKPPRSGLRLGLVTVVTLILAAIVAGTLPSTAMTARRLAYPSPSVSITISAGPSTRVGDAIQFAAAVQAGRDLTYSWDFGDGAAGHGSNVTHAYSNYQSGGYTVTLLAQDPLDQSTVAHSTVTVLPQPPQACFTATSDPNDPFDVNFDASCSNGTQLSYQWNFGDGSGSQNGPQASNRYAQLGTYTVSLTVTDVANQTNSLTHSVQVSIPQPHAAFTATIDTFDAFCVNVDASASTGYQISYSWDFGDGSTAGPEYSSQNYNCYANTGNYTITLTVTDAGNQTSRTSQSVNITG